MMKNVIKAQLYQIVRQRNYRALFLGFLALALLFGCVGKINKDDEITASLFITGGYMPVVCNLMPVLCAITVSFICADDFADKTANYELLSGTLRKDVFFGKVITALICSLAGSLIYILISVLLNYFFFGWGSCITVGGALLRLFLILLSLIRLCCFYIFIGFVTKSHVGVVGIAYAIMCLQSLVISDTPGSEPYLLLGSGTIIRLCQFELWLAFDLDGGSYFIYETSIPAKEIAGCMIVPIIFSVVYLLLGYVFFHDDDIG